jgi:PKD repeat protein
MRINYLKSLCLITVPFILATLLTSFSDPAKNKLISGGELTFTVRTVTQNGTYAPKHVLAIWVEDADGFVKTRKAMANQRKQYLYTWHAASNYNVVDAITGPTLNSHQTHTVTWNCTDLAGDVVPDGDYTIWVEFTEKHAQGPLYTLTFTKGPNSQSISPPDETYFKDIQLDFVPLVADFVANTTEICNGETVTFTDLSVGATSWNWNFGSGASPATATGQGPHTVTYPTSGQKTVSLMINGSLTETKTNYINVVVTPTASFTYSGSNNTVVFENTSQNADTYLWEFGDGETSTEENPTHTFAVAGSYNVSLTSSNVTCSNSTSQEIMVPLTGFSQSWISQSIFRVYPNPSNGLLYLSFQQVIPGWIKVYDSFGNMIFDANISGSTLEVDLTGKSAGVYFIEYKTIKASSFQKILLF